MEQKTDHITKQSIGPVIKNLEGLFDAFNGHFFSGQLEKPVITLSSTKRNAMGWCSLERRWAGGRPLSVNDLEGLDDEQKEEKINAFMASGYYEINICPEFLTADKYTACEVLLHEMCHLFNCMEGIKDCSRSGTYHNKQYKATAEAHGLAVEKTEKYGYSETSLTQETMDYIDSLNMEEFGIFRKSIRGCVGVKTAGKSSDEEKPKQSMRKLVCPMCGAIARVTKLGVRIGCITCNTEMTEE